MAVSGKALAAASIGHAIAHSVTRTLAWTKVLTASTTAAVIVSTAGVAYTVHARHRAEAIRQEERLESRHPIAVPSTVTPLINAILYHDLAEARRLVLSGVDVDALSSDGNNTSALLYVSTYSHDAGLDLVKLLVEHGTDINRRHGQWGYTALYCAIANNSPQTARYLLSHGADPNLAGKIGQRPLAEARAHGDQSLVDTLLSAGAK